MQIKKKKEKNRADIKIPFDIFADSHSIHLPTYLFVCLSIIYLSIYTSVYLSIFLPIYLSVCLSIIPKPLPPNNGHFNSHKLTERPSAFPVTHIPYSFIFLLFKPSFVFMYILFRFT